jgi:hypothetical protein
MEFIYWSLLMRHEDLPGALIELLEISKPLSSTNPLLHHPPEAFDGLEMVATMGWEEVEAKLRLPVGQRRRELVGPVDATPVDDHDHRLSGGAKEGHDLVDVLAKPLRIQMGDDFREDFRGAILDGPQNAEPHATGHPTPGAIACPRLTFVGLLASDLTRSQRA